MYAAEASSGWASRMRPSWISITPLRRADSMARAGRRFDASAEPTTAWVGPWVAAATRSTSRASVGSSDSRSAMSSPSDVGTGSGSPDA